MILNNYNHQSIIKFIGNTLFLMLIFVIFIDPTNTIFHKKDILFILLTGFCFIFYKPDFSKIPHIIAMVLAPLIPWTFSVMKMSNIDIDYVIPVFKSISPVILLLWIRDFDLLRLSRFPVILCCLIMDILFLCILIIPETESAIYLFASIDNDTILMSRRWFLGVEFFCMYLKSTVAMLFPLTYFTHVCVTKGKQTYGAWIAFIIIFFYFMFSGTRSTMLIPFFLLGLCLYISYKNHPKAKWLFYPILFIGGIGFTTLLIALASDTQEASNLIKYGHISSYTSLFENTPAILLTGQGPGAFFYSDGFNQYVLQTEWTYLELVRWFGIFSLFIIGVFFYPLKIMWEHRSTPLTHSLFWAYIAYLVIAGTNPLMLSSTGMIAMLMAYSYSESITKKQI